MHSFPMQLPMLAVIKRELVANLRTRRSLVFLGLFLCINLFPLGPLVDYDQRLPYALFRIYHHFAVSGAVLFMVIGVVLSPILAAESVTRERDRDTLDLLKLTPIRPSGVILAKLISATAFYLILLIASLPLMALYLPLAGLNGTQLGFALALLVATLLSCGMVGTAAAALFRKRSSISSTSLLGIAMAMGGPFIICLAGIGLIHWLGWIEYHVHEEYFRIFLTCLGVCCPLSMLVTVLKGIAIPNAVAITFLYQGAVAYIAFRLARRGLFGAAQRKRRGKTVAAKAIRKQKPFPLPGFRDRILRYTGGVEVENAILGKDLLVDILARPVRTALLSLILFCVSFGSLAQFGAYLEQAMAGILMVACAVCMLGVCRLAADALAREYEKGDFNLLRLTLMGPREIIVAKIIGESLRATPYLVALLLGCGCAGVPLYAPWDLLFTGCISIFVTAFFALALGLLAAALSKDARGATTVSVLLALVFGGFGALVLSIGVVILLSTSGIRDGDVFTSFAYPIYFSSPVSAFCMNSIKAEGTSTLSWYWIANVLLFLTLSFQILKFSIHVFAERRIRAGNE
jgi:ABC-type transport system involved in multi-copper enzyme maturation permease subunit